MKMEECMRDCMRKLALWHTKTFKPIMTHEELEPIMATLGFIGRPPAPFPSPVVGAAAISGSWKEYVYTSVDPFPPHPRPRLPYPRIDGLHIYTYQSFIDALVFHLQVTHISDIFHIRGLPLHHAHDRNKKLRPMEEGDSVFVYREGTLDQSTYNTYSAKKCISTVGGGGGDLQQQQQPTLQIRRKDTNVAVGNFVSLHHILL